MRVLVLAPYRRDTAPSQRYRIEQWMPLLERAGVDFEFDAFMSEALHAILYRSGQLVGKALCVARDYLRRLGRAVRARRFDAIYLHREAAIIGPAWIERLVTWTGTPLVYEFDDAIYIPYDSPANKIFSRLKFADKTATICKLSAHVIVGNQVLRDYAALHNDHVTIVPTTIDTSIYRPSCRYQLVGDEVPVIGWTGSHSSAQYLDTLRPAFTRLAATHKFKLHIVGAQPYELSVPGVEVRAVPWRSATEAQDLAPVHVGVMPLPDESWARAKCACKALQYMALGIPTVVAPVGVNTVVVKDGVNGLHATTTDEWVAALGKLLDDAALRRRLGEAAAVTVEDEYSARVHAPRVGKILAEVARA